MRALLLAMLACGCVAQSQIGPYVRSVQRFGPVLRVQKCMITLVGETLEEGQCSVEDVPIASIPMQPPPSAPPPPAAPPP